MQMQMRKQQYSRRSHPEDRHWALTAHAAFLHPLSREECHALKVTPLRRAKQSKAKGRAEQSIPIMLKNAMCKLNFQLASANVCQAGIAQLILLIMTDHHRCRSELHIIPLCHYCQSSTETSDKHTTDQRRYFSGAVHLTMPSTAPKVSYAHVLYAQRNRTKPYPRKSFSGSRRLLIDKQLGVA